VSPFEGVQGQEAVVDVLQRAVASDRVASAYLFEGPSGVGKERAALALATAVLRPSEAAARRMAQGSHPDVRIFRPRETGKRNIPVDQLRKEILPVAQFAPFEAAAAFLVFPEADVSFPEHPPETANALLKTLEEPRPGVHFVLLSERPERLLPTIRSRSQRLRFGRLTAAVLDGILRAHEIASPEARQAAIALSDGRADRALALADGGAEALLDAALALDEASVGGAGPSTRAAERLARGELPTVEVLEALTTFYRDVAAAALGMPDGSLAFHHHAPRIRERAAGLGAARAAARVEALAEAQVALERSGNPQIVLDAMLTGFA
jgi:DNA polymerase-3 subunit delta'